jgi:hypothetical protein
VEESSEEDIPLPRDDSEVEEEDEVGEEEDDEVSEGRDSPI